MDLSESFARKTKKYLVSSIKNYAKIHGFSNAILGLSGGIDSAVTCALACEALEPENIVCVSMPGPHSSRHSIDDACELAKNLDIKLKKIPITGIYEKYLDLLDGELDRVKPGITEENIQARIRANILMALSNKFGYLVLATGNKSELYTGYCTLYGDLTGGLAPIAGIYKTQVYEVGRQINKDKKIIPESIFTKAPSAELSPNQKDQDKLPPYEILDEILHLYIDKKKKKSYIVSKGFSEGVVDYVFDLVKISEFKRKQAPPAVNLKQP